MKCAQANEVVNCANKQKLKKIVLIKCQRTFKKNKAMLIIPLFLVMRNFIWLRWSHFSDCILVKNYANEEVGWYKKELFGG